jgi:hypothetical protein
MHIQTQGRREADERNRFTLPAHLQVSMELAGSVDFMSSKSFLVGGAYSLFTGERGSGSL